MTQTMSRNSKIFAVFVAMLALVMACGMVCNIPALLLSVSAEEPAQAQPAYKVAGWSQYGGDSITATPDGMMMSNASTTGYSYSNTTKESYALKELSVSFRMEDVVFDGSNAVVQPYLGIMAEDGDFMSTTGSYGIAFVATSANTYVAWFGKSNPEATAVPGLDHIRHAEIKLSDSGVVTVLFHREADNRWMVMINGDYQIDLNGETEINNALDAMSEVHVAFAAKDLVAKDSVTQTMKTEVFRIGTDMLGTAEEIYEVDNWTAATTTYERTEEGIAYDASVTTTAGGSTFLKSVVKDSLTTTLDGLTLSFKKSISNCVLDVGFGTNHGERSTFWDSNGDRPAVVGSFGVRFNGNDNSVTMFLMPRQSSGTYTTTAPLICGGNMGANQYGTDGDVHMQLLKVGENWMLLINGRKMGSHDGNFQTALNDTMNSMEAAIGSEAIFPWVSAWADPSVSANVKTTLTGWGTQRLGTQSVEPEPPVETEPPVVETDPPAETEPPAVETVPPAVETDPPAETEPPMVEIGDEITDALEFGKEEWLNITPSPNVIDVKVDNEQGFVLKGRSVQYGWNIGMTYQKDIGNLKDFAITVKTSDAVISSAGSTHGWYGMFVGDKSNCNFSEMRSIFIRWQYNTEDPTAGATAQVIVWDNTSGGWKAQINASPIPTKSAEGKETEVTIRFLYDADVGVYRVYANGARISNAEVEAAMTAVIPNMTSKYVSMNGSYETDGVGSAWSADATHMQEMTLVSLGGKQIVNKVPEVGDGAFTVAGVADSASQITLTWTKAEYPNGDMDASNFVPVGYTIERIKGNDESPEKVIRVEGNMDTLTYVDTDLNPETYYFYTIYAVDAEGNTLMVSNRNERIKTQAIPATEPVESDPVDTDPVESVPVESNPAESTPVESEPIESDPIETTPVTSADSDDVTAPDTTPATETEGKDDDKGCSSVVGVSFAGMALVILMSATFVSRKERS